MPFLKCCCEPNDEGNGNSTRSSALLLSTAEKPGAKSGSAANKKESDSDRPVELMCACRECRDSQEMEVDWDTANCLNSIGMDRNALGLGKGR